MSRTLRRTVVELFDEASRLAPGARPAFLERKCSGDADLRSEVESLLAQLDQEPGFLSRVLFDKPILDPAGLAPGPLAAGDRVASYRIRSTLGEGGMGVVYLAEQENPRREVALKILRPGAAGPALLARFRREAQLLGRLQHPGIAQIFEAGAATWAAPPRSPSWRWNWSGAGP
jgi:serine/threonine protein kinase